MLSRLGLGLNGPEIELLQHVITIPGFPNDAAHVIEEDQLKGAINQAAQKEFLTQSRELISAENKKAKRQEDQALENDHEFMRKVRAANLETDLQAKIAARNERIAQGKPSMPSEAIYKPEPKRDLLADIRKGVKLNKVQKSESPAAQKSRLPMAAEELAQAPISLKTASALAQEAKIVADDRAKKRNKPNLEVTAESMKPVLAESELRRADLERPSGPLNPEKLAQEKAQVEAQGKNLRGVIEDIKSGNIPQLKKPAALSAKPKQEDPFIKALKNAKEALRHVAPKVKSSVPEAVNPYAEVKLKNPFANFEGKLNSLLTINRQYLHNKANISKLLNAFAELTITYTDLSPSMQKQYHEVYDALRETTNIAYKQSLAINNFDNTAERESTPLVPNKQTTSSQEQARIAVRSALVKTALWSAIPFAAFTILSAGVVWFCAKQTVFYETELENNITRAMASLAGGVMAGAIASVPSLNYLTHSYANLLNKDFGLDAKNAMLSAGYALQAPGMALISIAAASMASSSVMTITTLGFGAYVAASAISIGTAKYFADNVKITSDVLSTERTPLGIR